MSFLDIFKRKPKSNKKWYVFYMHCGLSGKLYEVIDSLNEGQAYLQEIVRTRFVHAMHEEERQKYGEKNMKGFFPDYWPSPIYQKNKEGFDEIARQCVRDFVKTEFPEIDMTDVEIKIQLHADGDFASASFEYGDDVE